MEISMKRVILGGLMAATAGLTSGTASAYDETGAIYLSPLAQYAILDGRRISKDNTGYQIGLGYNFTNNWAGEVDFSNGSYKIKGSGASQKLNAKTLDVLY